MSILGPWQYLAIDIPLLSWVENSVVDLFLGDEIEAARKYAADIKLDPDFFELPCETP